MSTRNLLPAPEVIDAHPVHVDDVRERLDALEKEVSELRSETDKNFRQISELLRTARVTFGSASPMSTDAPSGIPQPPNEAAWRAWKERLPGPCGRIIDALLVQPLTKTQIARMAQIHTSNVSKYMGVLRSNGLLEQDGSRWRLKRL